MKRASEGLDQDAQEICDSFEAWADSWNESIEPESVIAKSKKALRQQAERLGLSPEPSGKMLVSIGPKVPPRKRRQATDDLLKVLGRSREDVTFEHPTHNQKLHDNAWYSLKIAEGHVADGKWEQAFFFMWRFGLQLGELAGRPGPKKRGLSKKQKLADVIRWRRGIVERTGREPDLQDLWKDPDRPGWVKPDTDDRYLRNLLSEARRDLSTESLS